MIKLYRNILAHEYLLDFIIGDKIVLEIKAK